MGCNRVPATHGANCFQAVQLKTVRYRNICNYHCRAQIAEASGDRLPSRLDEIVVKKHGNNIDDPMIPLDWNDIVLERATGNLFIVIDLLSFLISTRRRFFSKKKKGLTQRQRRPDVVNIPRPLITQVFLSSTRREPVTEQENVESKRDFIAKITTADTEVKEKNKETGMKVVSWSCDVKGHANTCVEHNCAVAHNSWISCQKFQHPVCTILL